MDGSIDAVVMWVDGYDPDHIRKRQKFLPEIDKATLPYANLDGRFYEAGEVKYCVYSIRKYAPWIRNIFLVTDNQCPQWLTGDLMKSLGVIVVDHREIFRDHLQFLPTFNTLSILNLLWKIPGLATRYIIFNDDVFIIRDATPEDFFIGESVVLRGRWHSMKETVTKKVIRSLKYIVKNKKVTNIPFSIMDGFTNGANLAGFKDRYFETYHSPYPSRRDVEEEFYIANPRLLEENIKYRFRNKRQFGPTVVFSHLMIKRGIAVLNRVNDTVLIIPRPGGLKDHRPVYDSLKNGTDKFLCFQDLFYLEKENPNEYNEVIEYLDRVILT